MRWKRPVRAGTERERSDVDRESVKKSRRISGRRREEIVSVDCSCLSRALR